MKRDDRRLSMSCISAPFPLEEPIKISTSIHYPTPVGDQVSAEICFGVKAPPNRNFALSSAVGSMRAGKRSTARIKVDVEGHIKPNFLFLVKSLSAEQCSSSSAFQNCHFQTNLQPHRLNK